MHNDGTLENPPFRVPLYIHAKATREKLLHNNHKHGLRPKEFNKNKYKSKKTGPPQEKFSLPCPKVNSVRYEDPYDLIHQMEHTYEDNKLIDTQEQDMGNNEVE